MSTKRRFERALAASGDDRIDGSRYSSHALRTTRNQAAPSGTNHQHGVAATALPGPDLRNRQSRPAECATRIRPTVRHLSTLIAALFMSLALSASLSGVSRAAASPLPANVPGSWELKFDEEFNSSGLNTSVWTPGWFRSGLWKTNPDVNYVYGCSENVGQPGDGYLHLHIRQLSELPANSPCHNSPQQTLGASVEANPSDGVPGHTGFQFRYGVIEWRVWLPGVETSKCPAGGCIADWPALWTVESNTSAENHYGEIDTMEGLDPNPPSNPEPFSQAHYGVFASGEGGYVPGSNAGWHTFSADWEPGSITYRLDGNIVGETKPEAGTAPEFPAMTIVRAAHREPEKVPTEMLVD